ncbi:hypothetical protein [Bradyrhizobium japonicum]|uniref:hypothetical protein n=1 Tax=Bradyrhizobium japonicum TaxID=375 RepID=UPI0027147AA8|nr:hypothetical protein [Bradyrhizobium japonicum]WLB58019.1 hypothetical protein QIH94_19120 [Bradyrhizobium japonicum]WLB60114.1 hypothetical protein QIH96_26820 [Bradyrhizobium japonicum]
MAVDRYFETEFNPQGEFAPETELNAEEEFTPLHFGEYHEADRFIGSAFRRLKRMGIGNILKRIAPFAAKIVAGAIPGVGVLAGPAAASIVGALTREQQEQLETALHEITSGEYGGEMQEFGESNEFQQGEFGEFGAHPESVLGEHSGEATHEVAGMQEFGEAGLNEFAGEFQETGMHESGQGEGLQDEHALMEQIAHEASVINNEIAAEALVGSLVPIATRLARASGPALRRATPAIAVAAGRLANVMRRNPATRPLVRVLPSVLMRTARAIAAGDARGYRMTPQRAVRVMAGQTYRTFNTPELTVSILVRASRRRRFRGSGLAR